MLVLLAFVAFISLGLPDGLPGISWPSMRLLATVTTAGYLTASFLSGRLLRVMPIGTVLALLGFSLTPS